MKIESGIELFRKPLYLESGRILEPYQIAWTTYGKLNSYRDNVILVTHALTGSHKPVKEEGCEIFNNGWWDTLIGDGKAIDTKKYFVISTNVIGSPFGSTSPISPINPLNPTNELYRFRFPVITIRDMVRAQHILLQSWGIRRVKAIIGGSMGGMQALQFGVDYPNFAEKIIAIASTWATQPWTIAFNRVTQEAIMRDPKFQNGNYSIDEVAQNGLDGLAIGRMAGHISFLSHHSMKKKFGRNYLKDDGYYDINGRFQVDSYLQYNGNKFSKKFDPLSYLYLTKAINIFDLSNGFESLQQALEGVIAKTILISFSGDLLFLPSELEEVQKAMEEIGKGQLVKYFEIDSNYGHDAFLVEFDKFQDIIKNELKN